MKTKSTLLFLFLLCLIFLFTNSCEKDDDSKPVLTLTGKWDLTFEYDIVSLEFDATLNLVQNSNDDLSGDFQYDDGSGYQKLLSSSYIDGNNVVIEINHAAYGGGTFLLSFRGTANSRFDYMEGDFYSDESNRGEWSANKVSDK